MADINKRLDDLERHMVAENMPLMVLYENDDVDPPTYSEHGKGDYRGPGKIYTKAEKDALRATLFIVRYTKNWRGEESPRNL